jgi:hypothetical protein
MSYLQKVVENFESDVFISYASIDDKPLYGAKSGWVTELYFDLQVRLSQLLGRPPKIWRDKQETAANDELTPMLNEKLAKSGLLLAVLSPSYFESKWCKREFEIFCEKAKESLGLGINYRQRIVPVVKIPFERDRRPSEMSDLIGINFYEHQNPDGTRKMPREFGRHYPNRKKYITMLEDLADAIKNFLEEMCDRPHILTPRIGVYLAQTSPELEEVRLEVQRDLHDRGFEVLSNPPYGPDGDGFRQGAQRLIQRAAMSIHLIGEQYGQVPRGEDESQAAIEAALAAQRCSDSDFKRMIWMPPGLKAHDPRQQNLIDLLENDNSAAQRSTDPLQNKIEDFKTEIHDRLAKIGKRQAAPQPAGKPGGRPRVYIVADPQDIVAGAVKPLEDHLFNNLDFELLDQPGGDEATMRQLHADNLELCDACVIFYGQASPQWAQMKLNDLRRVETTRPNRPLVKAIYIGAPATDQKSRLRTHEALVITNYEAFEPRVLLPLLDELRRVRP